MSLSADKTYGSVALLSSGSLYMQYTQWSVGFTIFEVQSKQNAQVQNYSLFLAALTALFLALPVNFDKTTEF